MFSFTPGSSLQAVAQQLLGGRLCRSKNSRNSKKPFNEASLISTVQAYNEFFAMVDKDHFVQAWNDATFLSRRILKQKQFNISLGGESHILVFPHSGKILIQCRGFRSRVSSAASLSNGFNRLSKEQKPQNVFDLFANLNRKFNLEKNNEKRVREQLDQFNSYKSEVGKLADTQQQRLFTEGFVKGMLSRSATDSAVLKKPSVARNIFYFILFLLFLNYVTGFIKISTGDKKKFGSFLSINGHQEIRPEDVNVTFQDVRGMEEAKHEVQEIVDYLRDPERYSRLGGRLPKGVLLTGTPGTGKTLLARAIAGEAQVPFFHASGSEFDEVLVGQGARRVRDLFEKAKEKAPCIIFIDEIDSVGSKRISNGIHPYANQTINQLLSEMDGFEQNEGVIVIGATNRVEDLDKALLRPGRFDVRVTVTKPDLTDRIDIFKFYLKKIIHDRGINPVALAKGTPGFTGADIENMINQAALKAATEGCKKVALKHLEEAKDRIIMGPARFRGRYNDEDINKVTAYHEAGHTLVAMFTEHAVPLHKVTIIPRGGSLGHTALLPEKDQHQITRAQMLAQLDMLMGGRAAEELIFGDDSVTTGPGNDLKKATELAISMVKEFGMSKRVGLRDFTVVDENSLRSHELSHQTSEEIDTEVNRILQESYKRAKAILTKHAKEHQLLAEALLEYETLTADEVQKIIQGEDISHLKKKQLESKLLDEDRSPDYRFITKPRRRKLITVEKDVSDF